MMFYYDFLITLSQLVLLLAILFLWLPNSSRYIVYFQPNQDQKSGNMTALVRYNRFFQGTHIKFCTMGTIHPCRSPLRGFGYFPRIMYTMNKSARLSIMMCTLKLINVCASLMNVLSECSLLFSFFYVVHNAEVTNKDTSISCSTMLHLPIQSLHFIAINTARLCTTLTQYHCSANTVILK